MKKYLLDTHAMIWAAVEPEKLSNKAKSILINPENKIFVHPISFWEISLKFSLGKMDLANHKPEYFPNYCKEMDFESIVFSNELASSVHTLQATHHRDPFDRMLIHTAIKSDLILVSKDANIGMYQADGLQVIW